MNYENRDFESLEKEFGYHANYARKLAKIKTFMSLELYSVTKFVNDAGNALGRIMEWAKASQNIDMLELATKTRKELVEAEEQLISVNSKANNLKTDVNALKKENESLQIEIARLKTELEKSSNPSEQLSFDSKSALFTDKNNVFYCPHCFEEDYKRKRLVRTAQNLKMSKGDYRCTRCNNYYSTINDTDSVIEF